MNKNKRVNNNFELFTLISTILASSMVFIDFTALNVALPAIQNDLDINGKSLLWIIKCLFNFPFFTFACRRFLRRYLR